LISGEHYTGTKAHDARKGSRLVQIKTTQRKAIMIGEKPECLIALQLSEKGEFRELYNGRGGRVWQLTAGRKRPKNGLCHVSAASLERLTREVRPSERIAAASAK
jgi:hypothetical protein